MKIIFNILFAIIILSLIFWWQIYRYQDCKSVGHSKLYCVLSIGK
jgi:hypothetical protein